MSEIPGKSIWELCVREKWLVSRSVVCNSPTSAAMSGREGNTGRKQDECSFICRVSEIQSSAVSFSGYVPCVSDAISANRRDRRSVVEGDTRWGENCCGSCFDEKYSLVGDDRVDKGWTIDLVGVADNDGLLPCFWLAI